ncbi:hypothetical protein [Anaerocolumna xylanovorans]|uniref:Uncharacterized protein n=1 Tax=Anaerocolumna xylanovorans DSM 12503 TaxID=1121345 RepID=A0A1M7YC35_9FIRM|nr:hypothetical protein [Anaerocolumna xylanovorans]SHO50173.1 hypothetical protein SAMN02745217_02619 [Anaerocolumna xylanovorans DSM 12503]
MSENNVAYLVTSGCYSDYAVDSVFLDKEKAYLYAQLHQMRVESYDIRDNMKIIPGLKIKVIYRKETGKTKGEYFDFQILRAQLDNYTRNETEFRNYPNIQKTFSRLEIVRYIPFSVTFTEEDEKHINDKYMKVCYDIMAYCQERVSAGYSDKQINGFLESKFERGKIE